VSNKKELKMPKTKYRIVGDNYCGYECQVKRWWFPVWVQLNGVNTWLTLDSAKRHIERISKVHAIYTAD